MSGCAGNQDCIAQRSLAFKWPRAGLLDGATSDVPLGPFIATRLGRCASTVGFRVRDVGHPERRPFQRDITSHWTLGIVPCALDVDQSEARLVGKIYRTRLSVGYEQALRGLYQCTGWLLWLDRPGQRRSDPRSTLCHQVSYYYPTGHGSGSVPAPGSTRNPEALCERRGEHGRDAEPCGGGSLSVSSGKGGQHQWLCSKSSVQHRNAPHSASGSESVPVERFVIKMLIPGSQF